MACVNLQFGGTAAILCGLPRPKNCFYCGKVSEFLCDFPVGTTKKGKKKTCDIPLCAKCTQQGVSGKTDFCKKHFPLAKAAYERRMARRKLD